MFKSSSLNARKRISQAIAYVKHAGLPNLAEGNRLRIKSKQPGTDISEENEPIIRVSKGVFGVMYVIDEGEHFSFVTAGELKDADIDLDELHRIGLSNLTAIANSNRAGLSLRPHGNIYALLMGGNFEASLVLIDEVWEDSFKQYAPSAPVVAVPARDMCAFCDSTSKAGIAELRQLVDRVTESGDHLLTEKLFVRKGNRWEEF
jgi:uncharacterized protein YtpQ (UPF0354 family)